MASHRVASSTSPLRVWRQPDFHSSGVWLPERTLDPRLDVRTPTRIYPDLSGPDTSCRSLTPFVAWNEPRRATARKTAPPFRGTNEPGPRAEAR